MTDEQLKVIFRTQELQRRNERQAKLIANEIECSKENLTGEGRIVNALSIKILASMQEQHQKNLAKFQMGYFTRLWWALKGGK